MDYSNHSPKVTNNESETTPICKCRVMYLGSSVPMISKDGLQGVQEPLKELYPDTDAIGMMGLNSSAGIDSWISVWSNGILIENVDDLGREVRRFFTIESLHYCCAVRYVNLPDSPGVTKFLPLDSPYLRHAKSNHPPLFACILRRTTGIKVLECHAFICRRDTAANALVRCCFHSFADNEYVKQMDESPYAQINNRNNENKDQLDSVKYTPTWGEDVTDSDHTASSTQPIQKLNSSSVQNHSTTNSKTMLNGTKTTNGFKNGQLNGNATELNSDDTEIMTTNSSISQNSPEEDEDVTLLNSYKIWPTSKSLSGSVKNLTLNNKEAIKIAKGASMRSLRPRQMVIPNMLAPVQTPIPFMNGIPMHALPPQLAPQLYPQPINIDKKSSKLLKKMKSKSMMNITLVPQPPTTPIPPHAIPIGPISQASQFLQQTSAKQQMMLINHPAYGHLPPHLLPPMIPIAPTPQPITGNIHSIKKKSKKNKEKQQMIQQLNEMQFIGQHAQPIYIPPMRPLTPLANYMGNQSPINNTQYLIQTIAPHNSSIYHTAPRNRKETTKGSKTSKSKSKLSAIDADELQAMINNQNYHNQQQAQQQQSHNGNQSNSNSPFNTGIYRKKGMMNERAFSYSIRNEHRSRSNSVANLNFNADEVDHAHELIAQQQQHLLNGIGMNNAPQRKLSQNGCTNASNNSNNSQSSPASISKQQQMARQQQYYLQQQQHHQQLQQQQQQLSDALSGLQLNAQPKTASIKRSKLNNNNLLIHKNGQFNGHDSNKLKNGFTMPSNMMPPIFNGKLVLPQNGNIAVQHPDSIKPKKVK